MFLTGATMMKEGSVISLACLQALLEFDSGEFHAHQGQRFNHNRHSRHKEMSEAADWLLQNGLVEIVGEEFFLTEDGKDVRDSALFVARKQIASWSEESTSNAG